MKWFKHLSGSLNNSFVSELIEKFGGDGYLVFFGVLELMSDEFDIYNPGVVRLRIKKLTQNFQLSRQKTIKILSFCDQKANETQTKDVAFFVEFYKNHIVVNCNKLAKLCDNHTQKLIKDTLKSLQTNNEATSSHRSKKKEVRIKNKDNILQMGDSYKTKKGRKLNGKRLQSFDLFWDAFNYKKGRAEAADAWIDIPSLTDPLVKNIINSAKQEALNRKELIKNGRTPKMAQGWITGKRWEDEVEVEPEIKPQKAIRAGDMSIYDN